MRNNFLGARGLQYEVCYDRRVDIMMSITVDFGDNISQKESTV